MTKIKLGIVGSCGRGSSFKGVCDVLDDIEIQAVCDVKEDALERNRVSLGAQEAYLGRLHNLET